MAWINRGQLDSGILIPTNHHQAGLHRVTQQFNLRGLGAIPGLGDAST